MSALAPIVKRNSLARNPKQIGNMIRRARQQQGLTQSDLGTRAGLRQETISLIETGNPATKIETMLNQLRQAPLGLDRNQGFPISVAGARNKTALLWQKGRWLKPCGTTPTTHIIKTQIGTLPNGVNLSGSIENELYGLKLTEAFGLPVNVTKIRTFGQVLNPPNYQKANEPGHLSWRHPSLHAGPHSRETPFKNRQAGWSIRSTGPRGTG
jgi:transcriptional regulator with XRE-family HTH domain